MRAKYIYEELGFERTSDVKKSLNIGTQFKLDNIDKKTDWDWNIYDDEHNTWKNEDIVDIIDYYGNKIKVAELNSRLSGEREFYAVSDTGEPYMDIPYLYSTPEEALKKQIMFLKEYFGNDLRLNDEIKTITHKLDHVLKIKENMGFERTGDVKKSLGLGIEAKIRELFDKASAVLSPLDINKPSDIAYVAIVYNKPFILSHVLNKYEIDNSYNLIQLAIQEKKPEIAELIWNHPKYDNDIDTIGSMKMISDKYYDGIFNDLFKRMAASEGEIDSTIFEKLVRTGNLEIVRHLLENNQVDITQVYIPSLLKEMNRVLNFNFLGTSNIRNAGKTAKRIAKTMEYFLDSSSVHFSLEQEKREEYRETINRVLK